MMRKDFPVCENVLCEPVNKGRKIGEKKIGGKIQVVPSSKGRVESVSKTLKAIDPTVPYPGHYTLNLNLIHSL